MKFFSISTFLLVGLCLLTAAIYGFNPHSTSAFVIAILSGSLFLIRLLNRLAINLPDPLARLIHWIHAGSIECLAFITVLCFIPLTFKKDKNKRTGRPILLVHGYLNNSFAWVFHKYYLEKAGIGPLYTINLKNPIASIRTYANQVKIKAEKIAQETGREDLILIGHSMGGLVSALYACTLAPKGKVTDLITIVTPFKGTPIAYIALGRCAKEMRRNSELLNEIRTAISKNPQIRYYHFATQCDELVVPGTSALLDDHPGMLLEDLCHISTLFSRRITRKIITELRRFPQ